MSVGFRTDFVRSFVAIKRIICNELEDGVLDGRVLVGLDEKFLSDLYRSVTMALDRKGEKPAAFIGVKESCMSSFRIVLDAMPPVSPTN